MDHPIFSSKKMTLAQKIAVVKSLPPIERHTIIHSYHVKRLALRIARILGFTRDQQDAVEFAARRHDIGKFLEEFRLLFFVHKGKFNTNEREQADRHAYASAQTILIMQNAGRFKQDYFKRVVAPAIFMVAGHHWTCRESKDRYDQLVNNLNSRGEWDPEPQFAQAAEYCRGDYFPLEGSRILKVADYFEARTEDRHYNKGKRPLTQEEAYDEIASLSGSVFEPVVISALGRVLGNAVSVMN